MVEAKGYKIVLVFYEKAFKTALKEMSTSFVFTVEPY